MEFIVLALRVCTCRWRAKNDWPTVLLARRSSAACRCNCMPYKKSENEMCSCFTLLLISILFCCIFLLFLSLCFVCCKSVILRHLEFCNCLLCKKTDFLFFSRTLTQPACYIVDCQLCRNQNIILLFHNLLISSYIL